MQRNKIIEVVYNSSDVPDTNPSSQLDPRALRFRDAALGRIEHTLERHGHGQLLGTETGHGELRGRFLVDDFEAAEALIWAAVRGTNYAGVRELLRYCDEVAAA